MGRLINTDDLIGCAIIKPMTSEEFGHILACENKIVHDDIPTAFDVEAVVKQIEEFVECNDECSKTFYQGRGCKACAYKEIMEIVRRGGVK